MYRLQWVQHVHHHVHLHLTVQYLICQRCFSPTHTVTISSDAGLSLISLFNQSWASQSRQSKWMWSINRQIITRGTRAVWLCLLASFSEIIAILFCLSLLFPHSSVTVIFYSESPLSLALSLSLALLLWNSLFLCLSSLLPFSVFPPDCWGIRIATWCWILAGKS